MKKVEALVPPYFSEVLRKALPEMGIVGMTTIEVVELILSSVRNGFNTRLEYIRTPRIKIELVLPDEDVIKFVESLGAIIRNAKVTSDVYISTIDKSVRIRTEELDEESLN